VGAGCHRWYTKGGSVKREAEAVHAMDEDVGAARGVGGGAGATRAMGGGAHGASGGVGAACGAATGSEVPAMEEE
jgi:hypothetical protein